MTTADALREFVGSTLMKGRPLIPLTNDLSLIENGILDSVGIVQLLAFIEERLHVHVPEGDVVPEHFETIDRLVQLIDRLPRKA
jgi:acyl carrier protein